MDVPFLRAGDAPRSDTASRATSVAPFLALKESGGPTVDGARARPESPAKPLGEGFVAIFGEMADGTPTTPPFADPRGALASDVDWTDPDPATAEAPLTLAPDIAGPGPQLHDSKGTARGDAPWLWQGRTGLETGDAVARRQEATGPVPQTVPAATLSVQQKTLAAAVAVADKFASKPQAPAIAQAAPDATKTPVPDAQSQVAPPLRMAGPDADMPPAKSDSITAADVLAAVRTRDIQEDARQAGSKERRPTEGGEGGRWQTVPTRDALPGANPGATSGAPKLASVAVPSAPIPPSAGTGDGFTGTARTDGGAATGSRQSLGAAQNRRTAEAPVPAAKAGERTTQAAGTPRPDGKASNAATDRARPTGAEVEIASLRPPHTKSNADTASEPSKTPLQPLSAGVPDRPAVAQGGPGMALERDPMEMRRGPPLPPPPFADAPPVLPTQAMVNATPGRDISRPDRTTLPTTLPTAPTGGVAPAATRGNERGGIAPTGGAAETAARNPAADTTLTVASRPTRITPPLTEGGRRGRDGIAARGSEDAPRRIGPEDPRRVSGSAPQRGDGASMQGAVTVNTAARPAGAPITPQPGAEIAPIGPFERPGDGLLGPVGQSVAPGTSAGAAPGAPLPPSTGLAQSVAQQILGGLPRPISDMGSGAVEIALDPPELGRVRLSLLEVAGVMTLSITAERPETADIMRRHLDLLAQEFSREGLGAPHVQIGGEAAQDRGQRQAPSAPDTSIGSGDAPRQPADDIPQTIARDRALDLRI